MAKKKAAAPPAKTLEQMTPEEQIRAVSRTCRGPFLPDYDPVTTRERIMRAHTSGARAEASALSTASRQFCGADFNDVILSHPLDGQERTVTCPECGQEISYRAPFFGDAPPAAKRKRAKR